MRTGQPIPGSAAATRVLRTIAALAELPLVELAAADPPAVAVALRVRSGDPAPSEHGAPDADDPERPRVARTGQQPDHDQDERRTKPRAPGRLPGRREAA